MKRSVLIDWHKVPGYLRVFYPTTTEGKVENIELAPSSITITLPDPLGPTMDVKFDLLPIIKMGISKSSFSCKFLRHEPESLEGYLNERRDAAGWAGLAKDIQNDADRVSALVAHRNAG